MTEVKVQPKQVEISTAQIAPIADTKTPDQLIAEAEALKAARDKAKAEQAATILEITTRIAKAHARRKKYEGDDEDTVLSRETLQKSMPNVWNNIQTDPEVFEKELADYKLSLLSPEEQAYGVKWQSLQDAAAKVNADIAALKTEIMTKYPNFFGEQKAAAKTKTATKTASTAPASDKPFTGTLNDKEVDRAKVKALVASGTTSETAIIEAIYGTDFTIANSKPRFQIHSIRLEEGLVPKKG